MLQKHYTSHHPIKAYIYARYSTEKSIKTLHIDQENKVYYTPPIYIYIGQEELS